MQLNLPETAASAAVSAPGFKVGKNRYDAFGVQVPAPAQPQWDQRKELRNKLAWVLGTAYGVGYSSRVSGAQIYAELMILAILRDHGYPNR